MRGHKCRRAAPWSTPKTVCEDDVRISWHYKSDRRGRRSLSCDGRLWQWAHNGLAQACRIVRNTHSGARRMKECCSTQSASASEQYSERGAWLSVTFYGACRCLTNDMLQAMLYIWRWLGISARVAWPAFSLQEFGAWLSTVATQERDAHDNISVGPLKFSQDSFLPIQRHGISPFHGFSHTTRETSLSSSQDWLLDTLSLIAMHAMYSLDTTSLRVPSLHQHGLLRTEENRLCVLPDLCEA